MFDFTGSSPEASNEQWLTSLTDLMMLLVVFFVIQIAPEAVLSQEDERQTQILRETLHDLKNYLKERDISEKVAIKQVGNTADISFDNSLIFQIGKATLGEKQKETMDKIVQKLIRLKSTHRVRIEGHTDNTPILTYEYESNWELSSDRSLQVLKIFINNGYDQKNLSAQGFGEFHPLVSNFDENGNEIPENQAKNRRVQIHITGTEALIGETR